VFATAFHFHPSLILAYKASCLSLEWFHYDSRLQPSPQSLDKGEVNGCLFRAIGFFRE
jgi:hypothetical protein